MSPPVGASQDEPGVAASDRLDDATLVARARHDADAFAVLFRRHVDAVHAFIWRRTRDAALADDLTAVAFERCWSSLDGFRPERGTLRPWLIRIAANEIASHYRSEHRRRRRESMAAVRDEPLRSEPRGGRDDADDALVRAISQLTDRHQEVVSLRFFADLSTEEAAAALGVSRRHFAVLQHRALAALRSRLGATEGSGS